MKVGKQKFIKMFKLKSKLIIAVMLMFGITVFESCDKDNLINNEKDVIKELKLKFETNNNSKNQNHADFLMYSIKFNFSLPLLSISDKLIVSEATSIENKFKSYVIIEKVSANENKNSLWKKERGYWWDGEGCFIYGTIIIGDNGNRVFLPADAATQYLMNRCGYEYLC